MTSLGITRRYGQCGLYRRDHDMCGTDWELLLPLDMASALHLHDHGILVQGEDNAAIHGAMPGIILHQDRIEARHALAMPASTIASAKAIALDTITDEAKRHPRIAELFASSRPV